MDFKYKNIGLAGVAGCGKNTIADILTLFFNRLHIPTQQLSIANNLKKELVESSKELYGIDSLNCSREEKDIIRPFLVAHGKIKRNLSNGRHWVEKLNKDLNSEKINIITDVRFNEYEKDETFWIKNEINGILIHVSRYEELEGERVFIKPANKEEEENDPKLKEKADFLLNWPTVTNNNLKIFHCRKLLNWLKNTHAPRQLP